MNSIVSQVAESLDVLERASMGDIVEQPQQQQQHQQLVATDAECFTYSGTQSTTFLKITLRQTEGMLLYENNAYIVLEDAIEKAEVETDNERYEYLTVGKGKQRKTSNAEAQTNQKLLKTRAVNTDLIRKKTVGTFVSNYDMFDTYADLERHTKSLDVDSIDDKETLDVTTYSMEGTTDLNAILQTSKPFKLSSMILQRILASNVFRDQERRFRNMDVQDPLNLNVQYLFSANLLFTYKCALTIGKSVTSFSWCQTNSDILAVGYGVYRARSDSDHCLGSVCLWNIKNPVNPERFYNYPCPVTAVAFSKDSPQFLAVGLYDGTVEIIDVSKDETNLSAITMYTSQRKSSPAIELVCQLKWLYVGEEEKLLAVSQDGFVTLFALTNTPYIIGSQLMHLKRVEGVLEGISIVPMKYSKQQANRHAQILTLELDPLHSQSYYIGTDEGCIRKCSIFYPNHHQQLLQVHQYSVTSMEFSPFSPRIFLTCGTDWYIRIWVESILKPIVELTSGLEPVQCARWSPDHATIILAIKQSVLEIWDIGTNLLAPVRSTEIVDANSSLTICEFSRCGKSVIVGDSSGKTYVYSLDDMPFRPYFQYRTLEQALFDSLKLRPVVREQIEAMGYLGKETLPDKKLAKQ